jgi:hypothetical protein
MTMKTLDQFLKIAAGAGLAHLKEIKTDESAIKGYVIGGNIPGVMILQTVDGKVATVQFVVVVPETAVTLDSINTWNTERRFIRAYKIRQGLVLQMDLLAEDITADLLKTYVVLWLKQMEDVGRFDWRK